MFRRVDLPPLVPGRLLLHSMPGRFEAIERVWHHLKSEAVGAIVCLNEKYEIREKSSKYADALETETVPCSVLPLKYLKATRPMTGMPSGRLRTMSRIDWSPGNRS
jgi:hypothetical protein